MDLYFQGFTLLGHGIPMVLMRHKSSKVWISFAPCIFQGFGANHSNSTKVRKSMSQGSGGICKFHESEVCLRPKHLGILWNKHNFNDLQSKNSWTFWKQTCPKLLLGGQYYGTSQFYKLERSNCVPICTNSKGALPRFTPINKDTRDRYSYSFGMIITPFGRMQG